MSLTYQVVISLAGKSLSEGVEHAARAGIEIIDSRNQCRYYVSKIDGREYRVIGALGFPVNAKPQLWQRIGCTSSDIAALLNFAASHARGGLAQFPSQTWGNITADTRGVFLSRALSDYGNDLSTVVSIPETVPATLHLDDSTLLRP